MGKSEFHLKAITENNYKKTTYIYIFFFLNHIYVLHRQSWGMMTEWKKLHLEFWGFCIPWAV